ncbi:MAG: hypothetical protein QXM96_04055 [Candidatus Woesearchaeota archaeon]
MRNALLNDLKEKSSFVLVFGDTPLVRLIDFFLDNQEFDYTLSDIARNSNISWTTLHIYWKTLIKLNIVKKSREIGRAKLYMLNKKSPLVKKLIDLDFFISQKYILDEIEKQ